LLSIALAYPISGIVFAVCSLMQQQPLSNPLEELFIGSLICAFYAIMTACCGGFPPADEGGANHLNLYPYIIPTAIVLFVVLSLFWDKLKRL
jgi:hypothetical protein